MAAPAFAFCSSAPSAADGSLDVDHWPAMTVASRPVYRTISSMPPVGGSTGGGSVVAPAGANVRDSSVASFFNPPGALVT
ncbi:MAG: hypothetical protein AUJ01_16150 [Acidobacteria bacterium 13_1_40CM_3_65_5]|nr:MAG: hypothetical protein AUH72_01875 [Acidobacteria bacterium 13_1_40CM_4_65_8]OLD12514.1 MAG: hypothetical protein AUJ01_16150 [Acidobacteria bacterium 13_1_40CM_3_65_5]OLE79830.1 MAG: hypothetical protein AUF76_15585 [Acidobacteria bacterium 13_1_20CM_2_65_9]